MLNKETNIKTNWSDWSSPINGLQIRGRYLGKTPNESNMITIEIELKNISSYNIPVFDFQDKPAGWPVSASYLRGMLIGIKDKNEPYPYHLISTEIFKIIDLAPKKSYMFFQTNIPSSIGNVQLIYDTSVVQNYWSGNYWTGRIVTPIINIEQK